MLYDSTIVRTWVKWRFSASCHVRSCCCHCCNYNLFVYIVNKRTRMMDTDTTPAGSTADKAAAKTDTTALPEATAALAAPAATVIVPKTTATNAAEPRKVVRRRKKKEKEGPKHPLTGTKCPTIPLSAIVISMLSLDPDRLHPVHERPARGAACSATRRYHH